MLGGGVGDFLDRFRGWAESAMSTWSSSSGVVFEPELELAGALEPLLVECGDWKY